MNHCICPTKEDTPDTNGLCGLELCVIKCWMDSDMGRVCASCGNTVPDGDDCCQEVDNEG